MTAPSHTGFDDLEKANMERKLLSEKDFSAMTELQYHHHMIAINFEEIAKLKRKMKSLKKKIKKKNLAKGCWIDTENKAPEIYPLFSIKKTDSSTANCLFCKKDFSFEHSPPLQTSSGNTLAKEGLNLFDSLPD